MFYVDLLVMLCSGIVLGRFVVPYLSAMRTLPTRAFVERQARTDERQKSQADEAQRRAGRQVCAIRS